MLYPSLLLLENEMPPTLPRSPSSQFQPQLRGQIMTKGLHVAPSAKVAWNKVH